MMIRAGAVKNADKNTEKSTEKNSEKKRQGVAGSGTETVSRTEKRKDGVPVNSHGVRKHTARKAAVLLASAVLLAAAGCASAQEIKNTDNVSGIKSGKDSEKTDASREDADKSSGNPDADFMEKQPVSDTGESSNLDGESAEKHLVSDSDKSSGNPDGEFVEKQPVSDAEESSNKDGESVEKQPASDTEEGNRNPDGAGTGQPDGTGETSDRKAASLLHPEGMTLETRFGVPDGYERVQAEEGSLQQFLRNYPMKKYGSPVLLYNGKKKYSQNHHASVFQLPIENEDLQQCADSVMRVYAEYFWNTGQHERIGFHFVNGFYAEYAKWRQGYRIQVNGNEVSWSASASYDDSYESFQKYLRMVFSYAGTLSMAAESEAVSLSEIRCGDVFLKGGSPGHAVMLADICENAQGRKAFLLAQGYMPAQEFHILINPRHENDPWYYEEEVSYPFFTPEYTFDEGSLQRPGY